MSSGKKIDVSFNNSLPMIGGDEWQSRYSESLRFPTAVSSKSSTNWPTLVPELPRSNNSINEAGIPTTILRFKSTNTWSTVMLQLMNLPLNVYWQSLLVIIICTNYLYTTYIYVFDKDLTSIAILQLHILDILYLVDFIICLLHHHWKSFAFYMNIKLRHVKSLLLSAVTLIPAVLLYELVLGGDADPDITFCLRCVSFLRFYNVYLYFKDWKSSTGKHKYFYFSFEYAICFILILHSYICFWHSLKCSGVNCETNWYTPLVDDITCFRGNCETSWKANLGQEHHNGPDWYLLSLYFWVGTATGGTCSDIAPVTLSETIFCVFTMLLSFGLITGFYQGRLINYFVDSQKRMVFFNDQLREIKKYLRNVGISEATEADAMQYYSILWKKKRGIIESSEFYLLPLSFQREVCYDIYINVFHKSLILRNVDEAFLRQISLSMKSTFYLPGEIIFSKNLVKQMMIYIKSGILEILSDEDDESPIISFADGTFLGEIALAMTVPAKATVRTATYVELQILYKVDFLRVINEFPEAKDAIEKDLAQRIIGASNRDTLQEMEYVTLNNVVSQTQKKSSIRLLKQNIHYTNGAQEDNLFKGSYQSYNNDDEIRTFAALYNVTHNVSQSSEPIICLLSYFPWILLPNSSLTNIWNISMLAIVFAIGVIYPYFSVFVKMFPTWLLIFASVVDVLFVVDCFIQCITVVEKDNKKLTKIKDIVNYRLDQLSFNLDIFSIVPLELGSRFLENEFDAERIGFLLRLNRLLRCYKIKAFFSELEESMSNYLIPIIVFKCLIYTLFLSFWLGSAMYLMTCFTSVCSENGWFHRKMQFELERKDVSPCYESPVGMSIYFTLSILLCIGFKDILPRNKIEVAFTIFLVIFGFLFYGYCISNLSGTLILARRSFAIYQEMVHAIKKYMNDNSMSKQIQDRVFNYFQLQWNYNRGILIAGENNCFTVGSDTINQKIVIKERMDSIYCVPLFQNLDSDFLQIIAASSRILTLPPKEFVTYEGEISREMYIIIQGYCQITEDKNCKKVLGPSSCFGDVEMLFGIPSKQTVLTVTHCQFLNINYLEFSTAISLFPEIMIDLKSISSVFDVVSKINLTAPKQTSSKRSEDDNSLESGYLTKSGSAVEHSFVNVYKECSQTGEDYSKPFRNKVLCILKFLLLPLTILPYGGFCKVWCVLRIISAATIGVLDPFAHSTSPFSTWIPILIFILNVFALIDMYVMLHVCYYNDKGILVKHPLFTAFNYIKNNFIIDLLACFPFNYIIDYLEDNSPEFMENWKLLTTILSLNKVLQIYRIAALTKYLESEIIKIPVAIHLVKFVILSFIVLNVFTSFIVSITCKYIVEYNATMSINNHFNGIYGHMECTSGSWFTHSPYNKMTSPYSVYIIAYSWITSSSLAIAFIDIVPENKLELYICISIVLIGNMFLGYFIASLIAINISIHNNILYYREMMHELISFMKTENVNKNLQKRLINHFEYEWKRSAGYQPQKVFEKLNSALMEDAVLFLYKQTFKAVPLFANIEETFLRVIGKYMEEVYFLRGSTVIRSGDIQSNIYIIYRGKVKVKSINDYETEMGAGGIFGNISRMNASQCFVTISALRNVDTLMIHSETFYHVLESYPLIKSRLNAVLANVKDFLVPTNIDMEILEANLSGKHATGTVRNPEKDVKSGFKTDVEDTDFEMSEDSDSITSDEIISEGRCGVRIFSPLIWCDFAILPESLIFSVMGYTILITSYINIVMVTYQIFFQECSIWFLGISITADFIFYINIILELHKAYVSKYGEYITNSAKMRKHYLKNKTKVLVNVFCDTPVEIITFLFPSQNWCSIFSIVQLLHLGRVYYIFHFFKERENLLSSNRVLLKLNKVIITFTLIIHIFSCILKLISVEVQDSPIETYISCLNLITNIICTGGFGKSGLPIYVIIYSIVIMFLSRILFAIFIADITTILNNSSSSLVNYENSISKLRDELHNNYLSSHQMEKVWQYVTKLWVRDRGKQIPRFVKKAPLVLQCDLMNDIYGEHIRKSYLFADLDENFLRQVTACLQHNVHFEDNYIVQHGDTDQNMYFIHRGQVNVLTVHSNLTESIHDILYPFDVFGIAQGLYHGLPHHFSFRAKTVVEILILNLNDWYSMLKFFPHVREALYNRANNMYIDPKD